jgi:hypothetical protein
MVPAVIAGVVIGIIITVIFAVRAAARRRTQAWRDLADRLGFVFSEEEETLGERFPFRLFSCGDSNAAYNMVAGRKEDVSVVMTDFEYRTVGPKSRVKRQTICVAACPGLDLPSMLVAQEMKLSGFAAAIASKITSVLGLEGAADIDFEEDPAFSDAFALCSREEDRARQAFSAPVRRFFVENRERFAGRRIETAGNAILIVACDPRQGAIPDIEGIPEAAVVSAGGICVTAEEGTALMDLAIDLVKQWERR